MGTAELNHQKPMRLLPEGRHHDAQDDREEAVIILRRCPRAAAGNCRGLCPRSCGRLLLIMPFVRERLVGIFEKHSPGNPGMPGARGGSSAPSRQARAALSIYGVKGTELPRPMPSRSRP